MFNTSHKTKHLSLQAIKIDVWDQLMYIFSCNAAVPWKEKWLFHQLVWNSAFILTDDPWTSLKWAFWWPLVIQHTNNNLTNLYISTNNLHQKNFKSSPTVTSS